MLLRSLVLLLVAGCAYIAGIMTELALDPELDTESRVKSSVEDFLAYPSAANYKNVQYYVLTKSDEGDETGYYCGEVFGFENELPHGYKRFIIRLHKNRAGKVMVSIPFVEKTDDIIPLNNLRQYGIDTAIELSILLLVNGKLTSSCKANLF